MGDKGLDKNAELPLLALDKSGSKLLCNADKRKLLTGYAPVCAENGVPEERAIKFFDNFPFHSPVVAKRMADSFSARGNMDRTFTDNNMASVFEYYWSTCHQIPLFYERKRGDSAAINSLLELENNLPVPQPTIYQLVFFLNHALGVLSVEQAIESVIGEVRGVIPEIINSQQISKSNFAKLLESVIESFAKKPLSPESIQNMVSLAIKGVYSADESVWGFDKKSDTFSLKSFEIAIAYYLEMLFEMLFEEQKKDQFTVKAKIQSIVDKLELSAPAVNSWEGQVLRFLKQAVRERVVKNPLRSAVTDFYGPYATTMEKIMKVYHSKDRGLADKKEILQLGEK
jgi:hypothetical protein